MKENGSKPGFAICVDNAGYKASLVVRKVYWLMTYVNAERRGLFRIVDESGEDYLFPGKLFVPIVLPRSATRAFRGGGMTHASKRRPVVSRASSGKARGARAAG